MMASAPVPTSVPPPAEEKQPRTARQPAPAAAEVSPPPQFHAEPKQDRDSPYNAGNQQGMTDDRREIDEKTAVSTQMHTIMIIISIILFPILCFIYVDLFAY